jgi:hypothetical protein
MLLQQFEKLQLIAKSWNSLDAALLADVLAEEIVFVSQWVLVSIEGKVNFLDYLTNKFQSIKEYSAHNLCSISAEVVLHPLLFNSPGLVITQITNSGVIQVSLFISIKDNFITRIDVCFIPDPTDAIFIYPSQY